ncbi:unnamed protein product, partial [Amoebophrya sp. A25]
DFSVKRIQDGEKVRSAPLPFDRCMRQGAIIDIEKMNAAFGSPKMTSEARKAQSIRATRTEHMGEYRSGGLVKIAQMGEKLYEDPPSLYETTMHFWDFNVNEGAKASLRNREWPRWEEEEVYNLKKADRQDWHRARQAG